MKFTLTPPYLKDQWLKLITVKRWDQIHLSMGTYFRMLPESSFSVAERVSCIKFQAFSASSPPLFQLLRILKHILHVNILIFVYKTINRLSPSCFHNYFQWNSSIHKIGTRQATRGDLLKSLKNPTLGGLQTIQYFGSKHWNTLLLFIRVASSVPVFRSKLKTHFLNSY